MYVPSLHVSPLSPRRNNSNHRLHNCFASCCCGGGSGSGPCAFFYFRCGGLGFVHGNAVYFHLFLFVVLHLSFYLLLSGFYLLKFDPQCVHLTFQAIAKGCVPATQSLFGGLVTMVSAAASQSWCTTPPPVRSSCVQTCDKRTVPSQAECAR